MTLQLLAAMYTRRAERIVSRAFATNSKIPTATVKYYMDAADHLRSLDVEPKNVIRQERPSTDRIVRELPTYLIS